MKFKLLVSLTVLFGSTALLVVNTKLNTVEENNKELKEEVSLYKELNERQQDIILEYKVVSGIEVSSITKTLDNKELIKQLDEKIKKLEDK